MFFVTHRLGTGLSAVLLLTSTLCWAPGSGGSPKTAQRGGHGARAASPPRGVHGHHGAALAEDEAKLLEEAIRRSREN